MFDEDGNLIHSSVKFDSLAFFKDPPNFNEAITDYSKIEFDPRNDPLMIALTIANGGKYPQEYNYLLDRHAEDKAKLSDKRFMYWKKIRELAFQRVERTKTLDRAQRFKDYKRLNDLRLHNLPFYYVDG